MHKDSQGIAFASANICEIKKYTTDLPWLTVLAPANPLTTNFQLQVTTNDYNLAGVHSATITIGFTRADLSAITLTQIVPVTLIHPCKLTTITTGVQTVPDFTYMFGDPMQSFTF